MKKILVLFAHPRFESSRANQALIKRISRLEGVTIHDLYEHYPDFNIDISYEKELLIQNDIIIWQHPFYWYSCPPLLKQWIDMVLEFGWAYGTGGNALEGKQVLNSITTGGKREVYCEDGRNNYTIRQFLRPFEQTARLCRMEYLPPFAVMGTHQLSKEVLEKDVEKYYMLFESLMQKGIDIPEGDDCQFLNDLPMLQTGKEQ